MGLAIKIYRSANTIPACRWLLKKSGVDYVLGTARNYLRWFGFAGGLNILARTWLSWKNPVQAWPPGWTSPVWIRPGTTDAWVFGEIFTGEIYRLEPSPAAPAFIVDAGANVGLASLFFARRYPDAKIVSIEPSNQNMAMLRRNAAAFPRIHPKLAGLWPRSGPLRITNDGSDAWAIQVGPCSPAEADFQGVTLPELMAEFDAARVDILKIDIEGSEWPLLFDAPTDWLQAVDVLLMEMHSGGDLGLLKRGCRLIESHGLLLCWQTSGVYCFRR